MTYCLGITVEQGLVFASDSRTSAGVDDVRTYSKMHIYEFPGKRLFVLLTSGNLATTQSVVQQVARDIDNSQSERSLLSVRHLSDAAEYVGHLNVRAQKKVAEAVDKDVNLEATFILGGQIKGEDAGLYLIYPIGNYIATSPQTPFLQIGESKYGKPILDRIISPSVGIEDAARCALVSIDATIRSNISVGPPLEVLMIRRDAMQVDKHLRMDFDTPYYHLLQDVWARELEAIFPKLPRFAWEVNERGVTQPVADAGIIGSGAIDSGMAGHTDPFKR